jgi:hypothetical protein
MATIFLLMKPGLWQGDYTFNEAILIEAAVFGLAGLLGCAIAPTRPFRAAFTGLVGAFVGMIADADSSDRASGSPLLFDAAIVPFK